MVDHPVAEDHGLYPIRTVCQLTGVNPITLRAWERRYGLVKPVRTEKGHRLYSKRDIEEIQRITQLVKQGLAISQVSPVLERLATEAPPETAAESPSSTGVSWLEAYAHALAALDEPGLDRMEAEALGFASADAVLSLHLLPMLDDMETKRLHDASLDAQFHTLQTRLTRLLSQSASACIVPANAPQVLTASLPPERGLFSLWRWVWRLRRAGVQARLLGSGISVFTLEHALRTLSSHNLLLVFDHTPPAAVMGTQLPLLMTHDRPVYAVGAQMPSLRETLEARGVRVLAEDNISPVDFSRDVS
mgnify:FL=1